MIPLMKYAFIEEAETKKALAEFILNADRLSMGDQCALFEKNFAEFQGCPDAVLFNSGGSANLAMLQALKNLGRLKDGDRIGFSALTWSTNVMPIIQLGMIPVAVDCDRNTLNIMSELFLERLEQVDMQALFITNALGFAGDLTRIREICDERGIILIEDNCESLGTELDGKKTGNFGEMGSHSFYVAHHMSTIEGGMVAVETEELAEMLRIVRANGWDRNLSTKQQQKWRSQSGITSEFQAKYTFYDLGYNLRPTEITGFIGNTQLRFLADAIKTREANYKRLEGVIRDNPDITTLDYSHITLLSNFSFPIVCNTPELRGQYVARFQEAEVEIRPMIAGNIQEQPFYSRYVKEKYPLPHTDFLDTCGFYCGNYPDLTDEDLDVLARCLTR